jgi:hypothetical protein
LEQPERDDVEGEGADVVAEELQEEVEGAELRRRYHHRLLRILNKRKISREILTINLLKCIHL